MKKKIFAVIVALIIISTYIPGAIAKDSILQNDTQIEVLTDLGLLRSYREEADVSCEMFKEALGNIYGADVYSTYFDGIYDLKQPLLYGQLLMILVDITGYTPMVKQLQLDTEKAESYYTVAMRAGMKVKSITAFDKPVKMKDYCTILYSALTDVELLSVTVSGNKTEQYYVEKGVTLLNSVMKLEAFRGIMGGAGKTSVYSGENHGEREIAIDGEWYLCNLKKDLIKYVGLSVEVLYDGEEIKSVVPLNGNNVLTVSSGDIISSGASNLKLSYYNENNRKKTLRISPQADFIYNFRLLENYSKADLLKDDCTYTFKDNNSDSVIDVIFAEKYDTFTADTVIAEDARIIDTKSRVYDLEEYLEDGGKIRNASGEEITIEDIGGFHTVSVAMDYSQKEYCAFVVSAKRENGIFMGFRDKMQFVDVSGTEYEALARYYKNPDDYEKINIGDEVELFLDFRGYIADIKCTENTVLAGYFLRGETGSFGKAKFKVLNENGEIEILETTSKVTLNGEKKAASALGKEETLFSDGEFIPQLILYKASEKGIFRMDTARDNSGIGRRESGEFSLDYDWQNESTLRAINLNGQKVLGSKYMTTTDTLVFGVSTELDECYTQSGSAIPIQTGLKCRIYNVDENYVPEYIVLESNPGLGSWVDVWEPTYIVDKVIYANDRETGDSNYVLCYFDGEGNSYKTVMRSGELKTPGGNVLSGDNRLRSVLSKDLKRGTVVQFNDNKYGISSISIQAMPMKDNSEYLFEKSNSTTSSEYGINKYMFNGSSIMSYGKVVKRTPGGIIINNHIPTDVEAASGGVFPMDEWNRAIPLSAADFVWIYDKASKTLEKGRAAEIIEGDMIFIHRRATTVMSIIIYR